MRLFIALLACLAPLAASAQTANDPAFRLLTALREGGCTLVEADEAAFYARTGFDDSTAAEAAMALILNGLAVLDFGDSTRITLAPALCDAAADVRGALIGAHRLNGCAMTEAEADSLLTRAGADAGDGAAGGAGDDRRGRGAFHR